MCLEPHKQLLKRVGMNDCNVGYCMMCGEFVGLDDVVADYGCDTTYDFVRAE